MTFVRPRWNTWIAFAAVVAFAVALGLWLLASTLASWRAQRERLVEAAWSEERSDVPRPSHVPAPLAGTFGELLEPHLAALGESYAAYKQLGSEGHRRVMRICTGQDPVGQRRITGVAITRIALHGCERALSIAPAEALEPLRAQIVAIRSGTPRFAEILERERLFQQLSLSFDDPRLPASARAFIAEAHQKNSPVDFAILLSSAFLRDRFAKRIDADIDAQRLAWPRCSEEMEELKRRNGRNWVGKLYGDFAPLLRPHRDALLQLDALACAASVSLIQARTGALPGDVASACPPVEPQATCAEQAAPMRLVADGGFPRVSVTLSDGSEFAVPLARPQGTPAVHRRR